MEVKILFGGKKYSFYSGKVVRTVPMSAKNRTNGLAAFIEPEDEGVPNCDGKPIRFWVTRGPRPTGSRFGVCSVGQILKLTAPSFFSVEPDTRVFFLPPSSSSQSSVFPVSSYEEVIRELERMEEAEVGEEIISRKDHRWVE